MIQSITRKFLLKELPDLSNIAKVTYKRHYLYISQDVVIRLQDINSTFELERKANKSDLIREGETIQITKEEFDELKKFSKNTIVRDSYQISENPKTMIRIYHGKYEGLARVEVNFRTEKEALEFIPLNWFGREITGTPLSQHGYLLQLTKEDFLRLLK